MVLMFKKCPYSVDNFEIPGHTPSSRTEENAGKFGQAIQNKRYLTIIDVCNI
jgi:hypothetical protein